VENASKSVIVVGGGAAGIQASLDLANMDFTVYLIERSPSIGEEIVYAERNSQSVSLVTPLYPSMIECARHPRIALRTNSEVVGLKKTPTGFSVKVLQNPRYIKMDKCIGCQACADKCPSKVPNELDSGRSTRKAIYMALPESVPRIVSIDSKNCLFFTKKICRVCEKFCTSGAIDFDQKPDEIEINGARIIVAPKLNIKVSSVFPDAKDAGIFRCKYPQVCRPEDWKEATRLGAAAANAVCQDIIGASGVPELNRRSMPSPRGNMAVVDQSKCDACGACESLCASNAPHVSSDGGQKVCKIDPLRCEGCGACVSGCPRFAISLENSSDDDILKRVKAILDESEDSNEPRILMFACKYCGFPLSEQTGAWKSAYPGNVKVVGLPCSGRLDPFMVAAAFRDGADGVIISGCRPKYCHYLIGNNIAEERFKSLESAINALNAGSGRLRLQWISPSEPKPFAAFVKEMTENLSALGPNPIRMRRDSIV
jgi:heterodisulfide reductase subunit A-like polyferredoxin/coenzyme F420-reducing hydrogenase delta subunit